MKPKNKIIRTFSHGQFIYRKCNFNKVSNLFELLVVSSKDKRFNEWIKCFELIFDVTADQIMTDYNELLRLVNVTTTTYRYNYAILYMGGDHSYNWTTVIPNRNQF